MVLSGDHGDQGDHGEQGEQVEPAGEFPGIAREELARMTPYQREILLWAYQTKQRGLKRHLLIQAYAGSGKTTALKHLAQMLGTMDREMNILAIVFNRHNAVTLRERLPGHVDVSTTHALGRRAIVRWLGPAKRWDHSEGKYSDLCTAHVARRVEAVAVDRGDAVARALVAMDESERSDFTRGLAKLVTMAMLTRTVTMCGRVAQVDEEALYSMALLYDCDPEVAELGADMVAPIVTAGVQLVLGQGKGDFVDQLFIPASLPDVGRCVPRYNVVLLDECLPYHTPVLLADGTSLPIGDIVEQQLPVTVLGYDTASGRQRACRVTNWSKTPNRKPLVKIRTLWDVRVGTNHPRAFVVCTTDHKVWADGTWVPAGAVKPGMKVQVETSAQRTQRYKITTQGRGSLAETMREQNAARTQVSGSRVGPTVRGGNGAGLTVPEALLLEALGEGWVAGHIVRTHAWKDERGLPTHYKLDLANAGLGIAVELDGSTHRIPERQQADARKDAFLHEQGWRVIRIPNRRAVQETEQVVAEIMAADCPVSATVIAVEPVSLPDYFVYDITVEDCHDFYANGILVHNCQDLNRCQHALARLAVGRLGVNIAVGDRQQAIMMFGGADSGGMDRIKEMFGSDELPLPTCWRCPASHIREAQEIVPGILPRPGAPEGTIVRGLQVDQMLDQLRPNTDGGDLVLCRQTAPLLDVAWQAIENGTRVDFRGRSIGEALLALVKKVIGRGKRQVLPLDEFIEKLDGWEHKQAQKIERKNGPGTDNALQSLEDRVRCVRTLARRTYGIVEDGCEPTTEDLRTVVEEMFADVSGPRVTFSTVHRAKGDERARVWIIAPDLLGPGRRDKTPEARQQALNIQYVAMTRSTDWLGYVDYQP